MDDFSKRRWEVKTNPNDHPPKQALEAALAAIEENGEPEHCIVIFGKKPESGGVQAWTYFSAGRYSLFESKGLVFHVATKM